MEANAFKFELWCYVEDVEQSARVRSDLHFDLYQRLNEAGITIGAAAAAPPPTIVQIPELEKLAAAAAASALAIEADLIGGKSDNQQTETSDESMEDAARSDSAQAK
ncbi:MAG: mechanosensitive ion channel family protein, partial [Alphaproteobacteria bacterium]|nr:mechanosensitive ion channel family protein [Alphaproteobacteria bacterium]MBM3651414.1 mechanosensitive ion channel family protein [Alphaproteobacteria bacterium]